MKGVIAYMLGPNSQYRCLDASQGVDSNGVIPEDNNGSFEYPDAVEENYSKKDLRMEEGGV